MGLIQKPIDLATKVRAPMIVADPACPLGECTAKFLNAVGLADKLGERLHRADNSRAVVSSLRAREAAAGIIFESDLRNLTDFVPLIRIPAAKAKTTYEGAVIAGSLVVDEAKQLLRYLKSDSAQACFVRCGFGG